VTGEADGVKGRAANIRDLAGGAVWLSVAAFVVAAAVRLGVGPPDEPGPGFLPFWSGIALAVLAVALLVAALRKQSGELPAEEAPAAIPLRTGLPVVAALSAYYWVLPRLGYLIATSGLMLVLFGAGRSRSRTVVAGSLLAVLLSYALFHLVLKVPLPGGILAF
jgi:hypothetical protein